MEFFTIHISASYFGWRERGGKRKEGGEGSKEVKNKGRKKGRKEGRKGGKKVRRKG